MVSQVQSEIGLAFSDKKKMLLDKFKTIFCSLFYCLQFSNRYACNAKILSTVFADSYSKVRELVQV